MKSFDKLTDRLTSVGTTANQYTTVVTVSLVAIAACLAGIVLILLMQVAK